MPDETAANSQTTQKKKLFSKRNIVFAIIFYAALAILIGVIVFFAVTCGKPTNDTFSEKTLKHYDALWLEKPQGVTAEKSYCKVGEEVLGKEDKHDVNYYFCRTQNGLDYFNQYAENIFNTLVNNHYFTGFDQKHTVDIEYFYTSYFTSAKYSQNFSDFYSFDEQTGEHIYSISYQTRYETEEEPFYCNLKLTFTESEDSEYNFTLTLDRPNHDCGFDMLWPIKP